MASTVVVTDAGPLIALSAIAQLELLPKLFGRVMLPPAVWEEVVVGGGTDAHGAREVSAAAWIERAAAPDVDDASLMRLGAGEAQAISLALSLDDALLLVDDGPARKRARALGVAVLGTLGVLRRAKLGGHVVLVRPLIVALETNGFRIRRSLVDALLRDLGEQVG